MTFTNNYHNRLNFINEFRTEYDYLDMDFYDFFDEEKEMILIDTFKF